MKDDPCDDASIGWGRVMKEPGECKSMAEVRAGVDALDEKIVTLLGLRMRFMEAAARIKTDHAQVRDDARKAGVIAHAQAVASRVRFPPPLAAELYELLVEASIAYELQCFDEGLRS
jgi:isochorismate pyruvate lyase